MKKTVSIIGMGRVGLPLSLFLENLGFNLNSIDHDKNLIKKLNKKLMPFKETGCGPLLKKSKILFSSNYSKIPFSNNIIITVGTPLLPNIETDLSNVKDVIQKIAPFLKKGHNIILRSTVAPKTTIYLKKLIYNLTSLKVGTQIGLSFCPERLAENNALKELKLLPQIIGADDSLSKKNAKKLFSKFGVKLFFTTTISAELVKLFNNASRYIEFATANQFAIIADLFNQNIHDLIEMANYKYPRGYIYKPGFAAGTCLRKDFGFINELSSSPDLFLTAWKINEYMPFYIADSLNKKIDLNKKIIGIMGYTFKKDSDDIRDSLVPKLIRYLEKSVPKEIMISDPNLKIKVNSNLLEQAIINLIQNALKYGKTEKGIEVRGGVKNRESFVCVQDWGRGISTEHHERLFERFYRVEKSRNRGTGGSGLGLAIVKHIAQAHGGRVKIESSPNKGSSFFIFLPNY